MSSVTGKTHRGRLDELSRLAFWIALVAVVGLAACSAAPEQPTATQPAATVSEPTSTSSPATSTTTAERTTTSSGEAEGGLESTAALDGDLYPGRYRTEGFQPVNFSFEIREPREGEFGWRGDMSREENMEIARSYGLNPEEFTGDTRWSIVAERAGLPYFEFIRLVDPEREATSWGVSFPKEDFRDSIEDMVERIGATDGLAIEGETMPADVGGAEGVRLEAVVTASPEVRPFTGIFYAEGQKLRIYIVELAGVTKVVTVEAPVDEFEEFLPEAEELLATVQFLEE